MDIQNVLNSLVPITQFNKGQASKIFDRVKSEKQIFVIKNNVPTAVILSTDEYFKMKNELEDLMDFKFASERIKSCKRDSWVSDKDAMRILGLTQADVDSADDIEVEVTQLGNLEG